MGRIISSHIERKFEGIFSSRCCRVDLVVNITVLVLLAHQGTLPFEILCLQWQLPFGALCPSGHFALQACLSIRPLCHLETFRGVWPSRHFTHGCIFLYLWGTNYPGCPSWHFALWETLTFGAKVHIYLWALCPSRSFGALYLLVIFALWTTLSFGALLFWALYLWIIVLHGAFLLQSILIFWGALFIAYSWGWRVFSLVWSFFKKMWGQVYPQFLYRCYYFWSTNIKKWGWHMQWQPCLLGPWFKWKQGCSEEFETGCKT